MSEDLRGCVERGAAPVASDVAQAVEQTFREEIGSDLVGIVFYGSRLNRTAGPRSDWDFFVVVASDRGLSARWSRPWLRRILPPTVFRREVGLAGGESARCKLSLLTLHQLEAATSARARDSYVLGRLSKRVSLVFARDGEARAALLDALARSVALCAAWTLVASDRVTCDSFARAAVAFSYRCEERVEGAERAGALFDADAAHFQEVYGAATAALEKAGELRCDLATGEILRAGSQLEQRRRRAAADRFMRRSRRRARLRWLKNVWTYEGWQDYMVAKLERHQRIEIVLSERERRHPLLAGVRHYLRLRRAGRLSKGGALPDRRDGG